MANRMGGRIIKLDNQLILKERTETLLERQSVLIHAASRRPDFIHAGVLLTRRNLCTLTPFELSRPAADPSREANGSVIAKHFR
jgi:hypothetical protein